MAISTLSDDLPPASTKWHGFGDKILHSVEPWKRRPCSLCALRPLWNENCAATAGLDG